MKREHALPYSSWAICLTHEHELKTVVHESTGMIQVAHMVPTPAAKENNTNGGRKTEGTIPKRRGVGSHATTGNTTNIKATIPLAMAWGSGQQTLIAPGRFGSNNKRAKAMKGSIALLPECEKPTSSSRANIRQFDPVQAITAGPFLAVPDRVLFEQYSNRPLTTVDLSIWQDQLSTATVQDVLRRNNSFSKLVLHGVRRRSDMLALIARHFGRNVQDLDVSDSAVVDVNWLKTLGAATDCPAITTLTAARCVGITDKAIEIFARKKGPVLRALNVPGCEDVSDDGIEFVAKHCNGLRSIDLSGCPRVRERSVFALSALTGLQDVALDDCVEVSDDALRQLFTGVTQLKSLSIKGCASVTEGGLRFMHEMPVPWGTRKHRNCALLLTFRIGRNSHISDDFIIVLTVICPHLRVLEVTGCPLVGGDQAMGKIGGLLELEEITLEALPRVSDQGIREFFCDLPRRALKRLSLAGCTKVTDVSLKYIAKNARSLQELHLDRNVSVTDHGLGYLSKGLAANLRILQATHLGMLSDNGVRLLARKCLQLTDIDLSYCLRITPACLPTLRRLRRLDTLGLSRCHGLFGIGGVDAGVGGSCGSGESSRRHTSPLDAAEFYNLRRLELAEQPELTDAALRTVAERNCKSLAVLNVSGCSKITAGGVVEALKFLPLLKRLDVTGCDRITTGDIDGFAKCVSPALLLSYANVKIDGFDGLHCYASARDARSRDEVMNADRKEEIGLRSIQRAFRRYRERERENQAASLERSRLCAAALTIQVKLRGTRKLRGYSCG